jgi:hypothetical protein
MDKVRSKECSNKLHVFEKKLLRRVNGSEKVEVANNGVILLGFGAV